jgi:hypothetical protein
MSDRFLNSNQRTTQMKARLNQLKLVAPLMGALICFNAVAADEIGQWDFNSGNLGKTAGAGPGDLQYWDGTGGSTESGTAFGTTTSFGIPNINGTPAAVMSFPACTPSMGYLMPTPTTPNGTNDFFNVNSYSLIMDLLYAGDAANAWRALIQTDGVNGSDGDFFIRADGGIGISGIYNGQVLSNTWHRVGFVFDKPNGVLRKYIDGALVGSQSYGGQDSRFSLPPASSVLLFTDEDNETAAGYVNSIQLRDRALTTADMIALGGPSAAGIPLIIPVLDLAISVSPTNLVDAEGMASTCFTATITAGSGPYTYQWYRNGVALTGRTVEQLRFSSLQLSDAGSYTVVVNNTIQSVTSSPPAVLTVTPPPTAFVTGQWDFSQGDLRPTLGQPLAYFDAQAQTDTSFGTTTGLGISDINGQPANVMFYSPGVGATWGGFVMPHGMSPNGGGTNVNQYTVIIDLLYTSSAYGYRSLWQTGIANTNDGDFFINGSNGLGISSQYDGTLEPDVWHRVVLAFDLTKRELGKYIDGTNVLTAPTGVAPYGSHDAQYLSASTDPGAGGGVDLRWSLGTTALLFADEDGEAQPVYVSSVQVRNGRMTDASIAAMGGPTSGKIPGSIKATLTGTDLKIDWTGSVLETAGKVTGPWSVVTGAAHPHMVPSPGGTTGFFRVRQ